MRHHKQQDTKEQGGVGSKLHHILQTRRKQLCRDWLKAILVSLLILLLLLYLLTSSHWLISTPALSSALPQHTSVTEGKRSYFYTSSQGGLDTHLNLKYAFRPIRGN